MGEAKHRGTFEERKQLALKHEEERKQLAEIEAIVQHRARTMAQKEEPTEPATIDPRSLEIWKSPEKTARQRTNALMALAALAMVAPYK